jgi:prepilin-type N-terminal cleavage/methylation domain-containing protein
MTSKASRGFSLLEMMAVISIGFIVAGMATVAYVPFMKQQHVTSAYNTTLTTFRRARDQAAGDMRVYVVTVTAPGTITVQQSLSSNWQCQIPPAGPVLVTATLPSDITFHVEPGVPTSNTTAPMTPDQFGNAGYAVDLDQNTAGTTSVCFNPDGTATDALGNTSNGVVYLGRPGDLYSSRAITLWGSTGRIRGWRLYNPSGVNTWSQQ